MGAASDIQEDGRGHSLHPRFTRTIYSHEDVEETLLQQWHNKAMPGAYLFTGPRGIGKASMAYRLARFILSQPSDEEAGGGLFGDTLPATPPSSLSVDDEHPASKRIDAEAHAGLLVISPGFDEKKKQYRHTILVDDTRKIGGFLSLTAGESGWRIIIVDAADDMNPNAANAMLKWLEEPPEKALFILIAHAPGRLLPTIRSRCRLQAFKPPQEEAFFSILQTLDPSIPDNDAATLYTLSSGAPGLAMQLWQHGLVEAYHQILDCLKPGNSPLAIVKTAEKLTGKRAGVSWQYLSILLQGLILRITALAGGQESYGAQSTEDEYAILQALAEHKPLDYWLLLWEKSVRLMEETQHVHLDEKQVLQQLLDAIKAN